MKNILKTGQMLVLLAVLLMASGCALCSRCRSDDDAVACALEGDIYKGVDWDDKDEGSTIDVPDVDRWPDGKPRRLPISETS